MVLQGLGSTDGLSHIKHNIKSEQITPWNYKTKSYLALMDKLWNVIFEKVDQVI